MTIIVVKDGIMASDSLISHNDSSVGSFKKIHKLKNGVIGLGGTPFWFPQFIEFASTWKKGKPFPLEKDLDLDGFFIFNKESTVWCVDSGKPFLYEAPYYATGSGMQVALGALYHGASAVEAVESAIYHNNSCGGIIQWWDTNIDAGNLLD